MNRVILPALNRCEFCGKAELEHRLPDQKEPRHSYKRDSHIPDWHGWHAARRGLGSNLYRLGVPDMVIQRILRHANVSTTSTYYIKTAAAECDGEARECYSEHTANIRAPGTFGASGHVRYNKPRFYGCTLDD